MEIKMLRPKCSDSERLIEWVEQGELPLFVMGFLSIDMHLISKLKKRRPLQDIPGLLPNAMEGEGSKS